MLENTCRLCLQENPSHNVLANRLCIKIMTLLSLEVEPQDSMPKKICNDCRTKLDVLYIFKVKCVESDAALRKLISTREVERKLEESKTFSSSFAMMPHKIDQKTEEDDDYQQAEEEEEDDDEDYTDMIEPNTVNVVVEEEHLDEWTNESGDIRVMNEQSDTFTDEASCYTPPVKRHKLSKTKLEPPALKFLERDHAWDENEEIRNLQPPYQFPLKTPEEIFETETWLKQSPLHFQKIVNIVKRKLSASSLDTAVKKCFEYEIVTHFWHNKGQRRPGGTSINSLKIFTDVFEEAIKDFEGVEVELIFRFFFKNARNCLRARKSRERHRTNSSAPIKLLVSHKNSPV